MSSYWPKEWEEFELPEDLVNVSITKPTVDYYAWKTDGGKAAVNVAAPLAFIFGGKAYESVEGNVYLSLTGSIDDSFLTNIYGGSEVENVTGDVYIYNNGLSFEYIYGGGQANLRGNYGDIDGSTHIFVENVSKEPTTYNYVYGAGAKADVTGSTSVNIKNSDITYVYGGGKGESDVLGKTNVDVVNSVVANLFGGSDNGSTGGSDVSVTGGSSISQLVGGAVNNTTNGDINVYLKDSTVAQIYGTEDGDVIGNVNLTMTNSIYTGIIYAGVFDKDHPSSILYQNTVSGDVTMCLNNVTNIRDKSLGSGYIYAAGHTKVEGDVYSEVNAGFTTTPTGLREYTYQYTIYNGTYTYFNRTATDAVYSTTDTTLVLNNGYYYGSYYNAGNTAAAEGSFTYQSGTSTLTLMGGAALRLRTSAGGASINNYTTSVTNKSQLNLYNYVAADDNGNAIFVETDEDGNYKSIQANTYKQYSGNSSYIGFNGNAEDYNSANTVVAGSRTRGISAGANYTDALAITGTTEMNITAGSYIYAYGGGIGQHADTGFDFSDWTDQDFANTRSLYVENYDEFLAANKLTYGQTAVTINIDNTITVGDEEEVLDLAIQALYAGGKEGNVYGDTVINIAMTGTVTTTSLHKIAYLYAGGYGSDTYGNVYMNITDSTGVGIISAGAYNETALETDNKLYGDTTVTFTGYMNDQQEYVCVNAGSSTAIYKNYIRKNLYSTKTTGDLTITFDNYRIGAAKAFSAKLVDADVFTFIGNTGLTINRARFQTINEVGTASVLTSFAGKVFNFVLNEDILTDTTYKAMLNYTGTKAANVDTINISLTNDTVAEESKIVKLFNNFAFAKDTTTVSVNYEGTTVDLAYVTSEASNYTKIVGQDGSMVDVCVHYVNNLLYIEYKYYVPKEQGVLTVDYDWFKNSAPGDKVTKGTTEFLIGNALDEPDHLWSDETNGFRTLNELTSYENLYEFQIKDPNSIEINIISVKSGDSETTDNVVNVGYDAYTSDTTRTQIWNSKEGTDLVTVGYDDHYIREINVNGNYNWVNKARLYVGDEGLTINYNNYDYVGSTTFDNILSGAFIGDGVITLDVTGNEVILGNDTDWTGENKDGLMLDVSAFTGSFKVQADVLDFSGVLFGTQEGETQTLNLNGASSIKELRLYVNHEEPLRWYLTRDTNHSFTLEEGGVIEDVMVYINAFIKQEFTNTMSVDNAGRIGSFDFDTNSTVYNQLRSVYWPIYQKKAQVSDPFPAFSDWYYETEAVTNFMAWAKSNYPIMWEEARERMDGMHSIGLATELNLINNATGVIGKNADGSYNTDSMEDLWGFAGGANVVNYGEIYSNINFDVNYMGDTAGIEGHEYYSNLENYGQIGADDFHAMLSFGDSFGDTIVNGSAEYTGAKIYADIDTGAGDDSLTSYGLIDGYVNMGDGDDYFDFHGKTYGTVNTYGEVTGNIDMGAGNDTLNIHSGTIAGTITMGDGDDVVNIYEKYSGVTSIDFGTGNDTLNVMNNSHTLYYPVVSATLKGLENINFYDVADKDAGISTYETVIKFASKVDAATKVTVDFSLFEGTYTSLWGVALGSGAYFKNTASFDVKLNTTSVQNTYDAGKDIIIFSYVNKTRFNLDAVYYFNGSADGVKINDTVTIGDCDFTLTFGRPSSENISIYLKNNSVTKSETSMISELGASFDMDLPDLNLCDDLNMASVDENKNLFAEENDKNAISYLA